ncbi:MAG: hypothetical protein NXI24_22745, partial [bacterium]|nr:hypothetical protein [bacterium]
MNPPGIVEEFDELKHCLPDVIHVYKFVYPDPFLEDREERFGARIVPTVSAPAHALHHAMTMQLQP